jgi:hypothetical protein
LHVQANTIIMTMEWNGITLAKIVSIVNSSILHSISSDRKLTYP